MRALLLALWAATLLLRLGLGAGQLRDLWSGPGWLTLQPVLFTLLGLVFAGCALVLLRRGRGPAGLLLALHCLAQAVHWGGPPQPEALLSRAAVIYAYYVISMLGEAALLHFTLLYPEAFQVARSRGLLGLIYGPVVLAALVAVAWFLTDAYGETLQGLFFILESIHANLAAVVAVGILVTRAVKASPGQRQRTGVALAAAAGVAGLAPYALALLLEAAGAPLPGGTDVAVFFFVLMPLGFTAALLRWQAAPRRR